MGCAEGQSPYAGSMRVSLRYTFFYSPKIGGQGVDDPEGEFSLVLGGMTKER
jgi:hypothetical protein